MSKRAEQRALEAYPDTYTKYRKEDDPEGVESGICTFPNTHNLERIAFVNGYEQAEKDLALTWEDIAEIDALIIEANNEFAVNYSKEISREQFYTEVLNRFNKLKEKKK